MLFKTSSSRRYFPVLAPVPTLSKTSHGTASPADGFSDPDAGVSSVCPQASLSKFHQVYELFGLAQLSFAHLSPRHRTLLENEVVNLGRFNRF
jgi:hypothetical protein